MFNLIELGLDAQRRSLETYAESLGLGVESFLSVEQVKELHKAGMVVVHRPDPKPAPSDSE